MALEAIKCSIVMGLKLSAPPWPNPRYICIWRTFAAMAKRPVGAAGVARSCHCQRMYRTTGQRVVYTLQRYGAVQ